jgi:dTDP-4-amino-4,6-dideoxygalactose transaminase
LSEIQNDKIILPSWDFSNNHVFHLFVIRTKYRNELQHFLLENGIETLIHYPVPPHKQKALKTCLIGEYPIADEIHKTILSLPISYATTSAEVMEVCNVIKKFPYLIHE